MDQPGSRPIGQLESVKADMTRRNDKANSYSRKTRSSDSTKRCWKIKQSSFHGNEQRRTSKHALEQTRNKQVKG